MDTTLVIGLLIVVIVVAAGVAAWMYLQKRRTEELAERYGPEYRHAVEEHGDRGKAEEQLREREERVRQLEIRALDAEQARGYARRWEEIQADFVDHPDEAIAAADRLVQEVMEARGYPVGDFERQAEDISVDHPRVVQHYRSAHGIAEQQSRRSVDTEDLRRALVDYRALFEELLETGRTGAETKQRAGVEQ